MAQLEQLDAASIATQAVERTTGVPRLIIADDHRVMAQGLRALLEPTFDVIATVHSGDELLATLPAVLADCLVLDLIMPRGNGLPLLPEILRLQPGLKVVVLTMLVDRVIADACFRAGAHGFVPKIASADEIRLAVATVLAGQRYRSPLVPKTSHRVSLAARHPGLERLTPRQHRILLMLGHATRPAAIAAALGVARSTITFHLKNLMRVLGVPGEDALLRLAVLMEASDPCLPPPARRAARVDRAGRGPIRLVPRDLRTFLDRCEPCGVR